MADRKLPALIDAQVPIERGRYLRVGLMLGLAKYLVDALVLFAFGGKWIPPLIYLVPLATVRSEYLVGVPGWVVVGLILWTLPFAWFGLNWSVRRARDAGLSPLTGVFFLLPVLNYLSIAVLSLVPTRASPSSKRELVGPDRVAWAAVRGTMLGAAGVASAFAILAVGWSVYVVQQYGGALFLGTPFAMGLVSAFLLNLRGDRGAFETNLVSLLTMTMTGGFLLLLAMEGLICILMAAPLGVVTTLMGAQLGRALARLESRYGVMGPVAMLPLLTWGEPAPPDARLFEVTTVVEIDASPEVVWDHVIAFPEIELEQNPRWFFDLGIAYPMRAVIDGQGVGAIRRCEFSTGAFVEPITVWDPPSRLAFDVVDQPPTMHEWSPYRKVWAPHLDGAFRTERGEFRLIGIDGGRTRLEGHTWYHFDMEPTVYWNVWGGLIVHAIHQRVLDHIAAGVG